MSQCYEVITEREGNNDIEFNDFGKIEVSLDTIENLNELKYAMAVSVAGGHSLIAWGKRGSGITRMLQMMPQLMPKLRAEESESVERIYSLTGLPKNDRVRPFRMPHQTASIEGICGGGINCLPGEISLAHNGVLFLDEAASFRASVLQMLRVPLESKTITLSRAGRYTTFPANFRLLMATQPCPCGNYGNEDSKCLCSSRSVVQYWKKFSAPLLDRIAIRIDANDKVAFASYTLEELRMYIKRAQEKQFARQGKLNQDLDEVETGKLSMTKEAEKMLAELGFQKSTREVVNIIKLARTVADMSELEEITESCIDMAFTLHSETPLEKNIELANGE